MLLIARQENNFKDIVISINIFKSLIIFAALMIVISGCKSSTSDPYGGNTPPPKVTPNTIAISGFKFSPASLTVAKGTTITWTNDDTAIHTATSDDGSWNTGDIAQGVSKSITFNTAGTFAYHCARHSSMKATIIVN